MAKRKIKIESIETSIKVIEQDLRDGYSIDGTSKIIMDCVEDKVAADLLELLKQMLLGFNDDMQLEIADNLLDFANGHVVHTTGCPSADAVLEACYMWIAEDQSIELLRMK